MSPRTKRKIFRWMHIVFSIPILGYIYSPFELLPTYAFIARYIAVPVLMLSGFWMWIASAPKKSILVPLGVFLLLLGLVGPLPFTPTSRALPTAIPHAGSELMMNLFHACLLAGVVCAIIGTRRNRMLTPPVTTEAILSNG